jgi:hypothetical protein
MLDELLIRYVIRSSQVHPGVGIHELSNLRIVEVEGVCALPDRDLLSTLKGAWMNALGAVF